MKITPSVSVVILCSEDSLAKNDLLLLRKKFQEKDVSYSECEVKSGKNSAVTIKNFWREKNITQPVSVVILGAIADESIAALSMYYGIVAIAVVRAELSPEAIQVMGSWKEVPVLVVADTALKFTLLSSIQLRQASLHPDSDIEILTNLDFGEEKFALQKLLDAIFDNLCSWLLRISRNIAARSEVMVTTVDGWEIYGTLTTPVRALPVPVTIMLHSGRSDRAIFSRLEGLLSRRGVATLSLDWRGRGKSQNKATYFDLSFEERAEGWRDVRAAISALETFKGIDVSRIAMIGVVHGAEHAVVASMDDPRVRMLSILTGYMPRNEKERAFLVSGSVKVMYVSCEGHGPVTDAMRSLVAQAPPGSAFLSLYPGGAIGYQLFDLDPELEKSLAIWVSEGLEAEGLIAK